MRRYKKASVAFPHLEKEAEKIQRLLDTIEKATNEIADMQIENRWLNYTDDSFNDLDDDKAETFYKLAEFIKYANKF